MLANNKESTVGIAISGLSDAPNLEPGNWTKEEYTEAILCFTDVNYLEFKTDAKVSDYPTLLVHITGKNSVGIEFEAYYYSIYLPVDDGDPKWQNIVIAFNNNVDNSVKSNIEKIKNSLKVVLE